MKLPDDVLKIPNMLCVNEMEAQEMTGVEINYEDGFEISLKKSFEQLKRKGSQTIVITLGENGAAFNDESGDIIHVPLSTKVKAVDTVGAGDAFIGALAFYIAKFPTATLLQKIGASTEIASHSVQFKGTQKSYVDFPSIDPLTKKYRFNKIE